MAQENTREQELQAKAQAAIQKQGELEAKARTEIHPTLIIRPNEPLNDITSRNTFAVSPQMKELDELKAKEVKDLQGQLREQALKTVSETFKDARVWILRYICIRHIFTYSVIICWLWL